MVGQIGRIGQSIGKIGLSSPVKGVAGPRALFTGGVGGLFLEIDPSTTYQGRTGTTPGAVGSPVGQLLDQSGNGHILVAPNDPARPILRQNGGGRYYLDFDGIDDCLISPALASTAQETYAPVFTRRTGTATTHLLGSGVTGNTSLFRISAGQYAPNYNGSVGNLTPTRGYTLGTVEVAYADIDANRADNAQIELAINSGAPGSRGAVGDAASQTLARVLGAFASGNAHGPFDVYGLLYINRLLTTAERTALIAYMAGRGGVTL